MQYTEQRENALFSSWIFDNADDNYEEVLSLLNTEFRSFGEGLVEVLERKAGEPIQNPIQHLSKLCESKGIPTQEIGSVNTLKSWFSGGPRPKKGEDSRKKLFVLAFVLDLDIAETAIMFQKVYLDRAFNQRNYKEVIYYYCIKNNLSYQHAQSMISQVQLRPDGTGDKTVFTEYLAEEADRIQSDLELIHFIEANSHNYSLNSETAKKELLRLKDYALRLSQKDIGLQHEDSLAYGRDRSSDSFLYAIITERSVAGSKGTITIPFKDTTLPKEIKNNFPQVKSLSAKTDSFEEIRKTIVLLFSYTFWMEAQLHNADDIYDDYCDQLNDLLSRVNYPPLYYGDPFDWMFLYCTYSDRPLDSFRGILSEVLDQNL